MEIKVIDRDSCRIIKKGVKEALAYVEKDFDIVFSTDNGRYSSTEFSFKLTASVRDSSGQILTKEERDFKLFAPSNGIDATRLGSTFRCRGIEYKITGWVHRRHRYPISVIRCRDGVGIKFPVDSVRKAILAEF